MNARRAWMRPQASGKRVSKLGPQGLVREGQAVLDVGREVVRARGRDDVHLERHAGTQRARWSRAQIGRVDPLVEVEQMARVEEDAEEGVAQVAVDDGLQRAAGLAHVRAPRTTRRRPRSRAPRAAPRSRRCRPAAPRRPPPRSRPGKSRAPQMPNAVVKRSPRSMTRSLGLSMPSEARGPAESMRWQERGIPFQPSEARSLVLGHARPQAAEEALDALRGLAGGPLEGGQLLDLVDGPQPAGRVDEEVVGVLHEAVRSRRRRGARRPGRRAPPASSGPRRTSSR